MKQNTISRVVWLFLLTVIILFALSLIPAFTIGDITIKQIDLLSDLRTTPPAEDDMELLSPPDTISTTTTSTDSIRRDTTRIVPVERKANGVTLIEDYSPQHDGMSNLLQAIARRDTLGRPIRIAFIGDSFIEADILTQNIREMLQSRYGGCGVGYMAMHSDFPGFRRSVNQFDKGWHTHSVIDEPQMAYTSLPLQLYRPKNEATTRFKGVDKLQHIDRWEVSHILYIAEQPTCITLRTDSTSHTYNLSPAPKVQIISLQETTSLFEIKCDSTSQLTLWGAWLDAKNGIAVDNISMRGYSGGSIANLPIHRLQELQELIPYDMIVLQFGLNRMTASITRYPSFTEELTRVVQHLRQALPHTDILIMGIGDRCENEDGEMVTMKAVYGMRNAQRKAAIESGCLFWDTCEAMKSLGGMNQFVENKWANKDYTHISHAGGRPLAAEFVKAIEHALSQTSTPQADE